MARKRQIVHDYTFDEQAALLEPNTKRLDDIINGALWMIANHAESCPVIEGNLRVVFTDSFPDAPAMRIFFTITNDHSCTVHWIEHIEAEDEFFGM